MSEMDITTILEDLAQGRIDAGEAKRRIDELGLGRDTDHRDDDQEMSTEWPMKPDQEPPGAPQDPKPSEPHASKAARGETPKTEKNGNVDKVVIKATARKVRVIADPSVSRAAAEDVHQVKRKGSNLIIHGDREFTGVMDALAWVKTVRGLDDVKSLGIGQELTVRVNPALEVDIRLTGGTLTVTDIPRLGKVRVAAGATTVTGAREIADMVVQAGQATIAGRFNEGWSRVRCESGQVVLEVDKDSDVRLRADAQLGKVSWEGCDGDSGDVVLGKGTAHLDVGVVIGHVAVKVV
ncbi:MAG: hypothetical protein FWG15_05160 [Propionibacteriaceae bacterium]|nr:hypothetical protein [Propionibacteriaceae bacterium]